MLQESSWLVPESTEGTEARRARERRLDSRPPLPRGHACAKPALPTRENDPTRHSRNQTPDALSASCALEILHELFPVVVGQMAVSGPEPIRSLARYAGSLLSVSPGPDSHRRRGASGGEDTLPAPFIPPPLDFAGDPTALSAVAEALRLAHGHQFPPAPPAIPRMFSPARLAGVPRATKAQGSNGRPAPSRCDREGHDWRPAPLPGRSERWARKRW